MDRPALSGDTSLERAGRSSWREENAKKGLFNLGVLFRTSLPRPPPIFLARHRRTDGLEKGLATRLMTGSWQPFPPLST